MARIAIWIGVLMVALGLGLYATAVVRDVYFTEPAHDLGTELVNKLTALIPAGFGLVLIILGAIAANASDRGRMHVMHGAVLIGLAGIGFPVWRVIKAMDAPETSMLAVGGNIAMIVLSVIFVGLCVRSFIMARLERKQKEAAAAATSNEVDRSI